MIRVQPDIQPMLAYQVAYNEKSNDLGQTVTTDELPHAFAGSLQQECEHLWIAVGITQPRGEVLLRDTLPRGLCPPQVIERSGKVNACELRERIKTYRNQYQASSQPEQKTIFQPQAQWELQSSDGIEQQNVTTP